VRSLGPFLVVGGAAALVHQVVVIALVETSLVAPSAANVPGFLTAWLVSYVGHRRFTFRSNAPHARSAPRFFAISLTAFFVNQAMYMTLLKATPLHYAVALFLTLLTVAAGTFVLSRSWAFAGESNGVR
jgi:putative flippase GtrA